MNDEFSNQGIEFQPVNEEDNSFEIIADDGAIENISGTGFFTTLSDNGVGTIRVGGSGFSLPENQSNAKSQIITALTESNEVTITLVIPVGEETTEATYTIKVAE